MTERLNFKKYGFIRNKENDFSDDGNRFKCYDYKGIEITYLKDPDYEVFLSARVPYYSSLELFFPKVADTSSKMLGIADRYNQGQSITNEDLESWAKDLDEMLEMKKEIDEYVDSLRGNATINVYKFNNEYFVYFYDKYHKSPCNQIFTKLGTKLNDWRITGTARSYNLKVKVITLGAQSEEIVDICNQ